MLSDINQTKKDTAYNFYVESKRKPSCRKSIDWCLPEMGNGRRRIGGDI